MSPLNDWRCLGNLHRHWLSWSLGLLLVWIGWGPQHISCNEEFSPSIKDFGCPVTALLVKNIWAKNLTPLHINTNQFLHNFNRWWFLRMEPPNKLRHIGTLFSLNLYHELFIISEKSWSHWQCHPGYLI